MTIGNRIRDMRIQKKLSQADLGAMANTTKQVISTYERGVRTPRIDMAEKIAKALSVSLDYLMGATDDPNQELPHTHTVIPAGTGIIKELLEEQKRQGIRTIDKVTAVNIMANNYGLSIIKRRDADGYVLKSHNGLYEVTEEEIDQVLDTMSAGIIEKLMYLEKDKQLELLMGSDSK